MLIGLLLAALGCCYIGAKLVRTNIQNLNSILSNQLRKKIAYFTQTYLRASIFGVFFNILVGGDVTMVVYSLAALVAGDLISFTPAIVMSIWGNIGTSILFYLAVINMKLISLYLIGITGIVYFFTGAKKYQSLLGIMIGFALLLYGMNVVKESAPLWLSNDTMRGIIQSTANSWFLIFCFGFAIRVVFQLLWINVIISIIMLQSGLFNLSDIIVLHFASRFYTGFYTWFLSSHYQSPAKQLMVFQALFSNVAGLFGVLTIILENVFHIPFVQAILYWLSPSPDLQVVNLSLVLNILSAILLAIYQQPLMQLINFMYPFDKVNIEEKPEFIQMIEINNIFIAMESLEKEHISLLQKISGYFTCLLERDNLINVQKKMKHINYVFLVVMKKTDAFLEDIAETDLVDVNHKHYLSLMYRQQLLRYLESILYEWSGCMNTLLMVADWQNELKIQIQAHHALFSDLIEALRSSDIEKINSVYAECINRKDIMDSIHLKWSISHFYKKNDNQMQTVFYNASQMYEISIWIMQRILKLSIDYLTTVVEVETKDNSDPQDVA